MAPDPTSARRHLTSGPDVVGPAEARQILGPRKPGGISRQRLHQLIQDPAFPPYTELEIGRVWNRADVLAFHLSRTEPRRATMIVAVATYRATGIVADAARAAGVQRYTVRRWLRELGIPLPRD
jgi:transcriptional regulator of acetoin/glycerol metabolism